MADKNLFDLLKDKMANLKPAEQHRDADWAALNTQLNEVLPQASKDRRRAFVIPLLLLVAFFSSNAIWWRSSQNDRIVIGKLTEKISALEAIRDSNTLFPKETIRIDTLWRFIYPKYPLEVPSKHSKTRIAAHTEYLFNPLQLEHSPQLTSTTNQESNPPNPPPITTKAFEPLLDPSLQVFDLQNIKHRATPLITRLEHFNVPYFVRMPSALKDQKKAKPLGENLLKSIRTPHLILGASMGWLHASSPMLMHQGGASCNLTGQLEITRHWSLVSNVGMGKVHYKAHLPDAILGTPELPLLPYMDHHFIALEVTGQKINHFDLGLRYTFAKTGKPRPFIGLAWGGQTIQAFNIDYEIQHEASGMIEKGVFEISNPIKIRNIIGFNAGLNMPLNSKIDLSLLGFYKVPWNKPSQYAPNLMGIQAGLHWIF